MDDFKEKENIDLSSDIQAYNAWRKLLKSKDRIINCWETTIHLPFITAENWSKTYWKELTRDVFEKLCEKLISRCRIPVEKALTDARLDKADMKLC
jgi:molecular chaperone DnaK (HSP70)